MDNKILTRLVRSGLAMGMIMVVLLTGWGGALPARSAGANPPSGQVETSPDGGTFPQLRDQTGSLQRQPERAGAGAGRDAGFARHTALHAGTAAQRKHPAEHGMGRPGGAERRGGRLDAQSGGFLPGIELRATTGPDSRRTRWGTWVPTITSRRSILRSASSTRAAARCW